MGAKYTIDGDAAGAVKAVGDFQKALGKVDTQADKSAAATKRLNDAAQRIRESIDPQAKYNRKVQELAEHAKAGRLSMDDASRAAIKLRENLDKVGTSGKRAFSDQLPDIASLAGQLGAAAGATATIGAGFAKISEAIDKAKQASDESRRGMGSLRQLADSDAEYQNLKGKAEALFATGATTSLDQAASSVFSLASAGQLDNKSFNMFTALAAKGVADPGSLSRAVAAAQSTFGVKETGTSGQVVSKGFAAAKFSPASVEALLGALADPGSVAAAQGLGDEEVLASLAVLSASVGEGKASTSTRAFLNSTPNMKGGIAERVRAIAAEKLDPVALKKRLSTDEAVLGFNLLNTNLGAVDIATAAINAANADTTAVDRRLRFSDPESAAALGEQAQANQNILANRNRAGYEALRQTIIARQQQNLVEWGEQGTAQQIGASIGMGLFEGANAVLSPFVNPRSAVENSKASGRMTESEQATLEQLQRQTRALERIQGRQGAKATTRQE